MEFEIGQVVISKAGRDKGYVFIVIDVRGEYLQLVDGKGRPYANPKLKKIKHVQPTKTIDADIKATLTLKQVKDSDFRAAIKRFSGDREE